MFECVCQCLCISASAKSEEDHPLNKDCEGLVGYWHWIDVRHRLYRMLLQSQNKIRPPRDCNVSIVDGRVNKTIGWRLSRLAAQTFSNFSLKRQMSRLGEHLGLPTFPSPSNFTSLVQTVNQSRCLSLAEGGHMA